MTKATEDSLPKYNLVPKYLSINLEFQGWVPSPALIAY